MVVVATSFQCAFALYEGECMSRVKSVIYLTVLTLTPIVGLIGLLFTGRYADYFLLLAWLPLVLAVGFAVFRNRISTDTHNRDHKKCASPRNTVCKPP